MVDTLNQPLGSEVDQRGPGQRRRARQPLRQLLPLGASPALRTRRGLKSPTPPRAGRTAAGRHAAKSRRLAASATADASRLTRHPAPGEQAGAAHLPISCMASGLQGPPTLRELGGGGGQAIPGGHNYIMKTMALVVLLTTTKSNDRSLLRLHPQSLVMTITDNRQVLLLVVASSPNRLCAWHRLADRLLCTPTFVHKGSAGGPIRPARQSSRWDNSAGGTIRPAGPNIVYGKFVQGSAFGTIRPVRPPVVVRPSRHTRTVRHQLCYARGLNGTQRAVLMCSLPPELGYKRSKFSE